MQKSDVVFSTDLTLRVLIRTADDILILMKKKKKKNKVLSASVLLCILKVNPCPAE